MDTEINANLSGRFIRCYNSVDKALRNIYDIRAGASFTEVIRISSGKNALVRKYEDDLLTYARLRNAIVHNGVGDEAIAEPHSGVVKQFEHIVGLICEPPAAMEILGEQRVVTCRASDTLGDIVLTIARSNYANIPVENDGRIVGVLHSKNIVVALGERLYKKLPIDGNYLRTVHAGEVLGENKSYAFADTGISIVAASSLFMIDRKLKILMLTQTGDADSAVRAIITAENVIAFNQIMDSYD
ncbi:MAG: CBS domain-containing protein [Clostridiales bacterium]|jgi:predicted transcriptional regulator|nr:CBS domain-containing protein [Clostridiales bacterium]